MDDFIIEVKRSKQVQETLCNVNRRGTVYVLELEGGHYYIGFTRRLKERLRKHFERMGSYWTKRFRPLKLLEVYENVFFNMEMRLLKIISVVSAGRR